MEEENRLVQERFRKLKELVDKGINPYHYSFDQKDHASELNERYSSLKEEEKTTDKAKVAGRIMQLRRMGKATFMHVQDQSGRIQVYFRADDVGQEEYNLLKLWDLGDIVGVEGTIFKTKTGEVTVYASKFELLCKSLQPLPEKYHGLKDVELKYRMRYVDMIMNEETRRVFMIKTKAVTAIREFLDKRDFLEVETPILQPIYGGANARPFITHHNALNMRLYLRISNELYLKRLLVGGFERVYEFSKDFRNEGIDTTHNPEFTQVELYQAYADYNDMMQIFEQLYEHVAKKVLGTTKIKFGNHDIDLKVPWRRLSMVDAIKEYADIDIASLSDEEIRSLLRNYNIELEGDYNRGMAITLIFEELCEDKLIQPTFIIDHPRESTPLCKLHREKPEFVERFEPYIAGMEIGNAYSELNDPILQREFLEDQAKELRAGAEEAHPMDDDFVRSLEYGMPPTGGIGMAIERMIMLLTNNASIRDVILFPTMKPEENSEKKGE